MNFNYEKTSQRNTEQEYDDIERHMIELTQSIQLLQQRKQEAMHYLYDLDTHLFELGEQILALSQLKEQKTKTIAKRIVNNLLIKIQNDCKRALNYSSQ